MERRQCRVNKYLWSHTRDCNCTIDDPVLLDGIEFCLGKIFLWESKTKTVLPLILYCIEAWRCLLEQRSLWRAHNSVSLAITSYFSTPLSIAVSHLVSLLDHHLQQTGLAQIVVPSRKLSVWILSSPFVAGPPVAYGVTTVSQTSPNQLSLLHKVGVLPKGRSILID